MIVACVSVHGRVERARVEPAARISYQTKLEARRFDLSTVADGIRIERNREGFQKLFLTLARCACKWSTGELWTRDSVRPSTMGRDAPNDVGISEGRDAPSYAREIHHRHVS